MDANAQAKQIYGQAFFTKLAEHGITPDSPETAAELLELAQKTRVIKQAADRRQVASVATLAKTANSQLDRILGGDAAIDKLAAAAAKGGKKLPFGGKKAPPFGAKKK